MPVGAASARCVKEAAYCTCHFVKAHLLQVDDSGWQFFPYKSCSLPPLLQHLLCVFPLGALNLTDAAMQKHGIAW